MSLTDALSPQVPAAIQQRGRSYFQGGRVEVFRAADGRVLATVTGSRPYSVSVRRGTRATTVSCECPFFAGNERVCKHIWATILAADSLGILAADKPSGQTPDGRGQDRPGFSWAARLEAVAGPGEPAVAPPRGAAWEVVYLIDVYETVTSGHLTLKIARRHVKSDGEWSKPKALQPDRDLLSSLPQESDRQILAILAGAHEGSSYYGGYFHGPLGFLSAGQTRVPPPVVSMLVPMLGRTGRCHLKVNTAGIEQLTAVRWDEGPPWEFHLETKLQDGLYEVGGRLTRAEAAISVEDPLMVLAGGFVLSRDGAVAELHDPGIFKWISLLRNQGPLMVPEKEIDEFLDRLLPLPGAPVVNLPDVLKVTEISGSPLPLVRIFPLWSDGWSNRTRLSAVLSFDYEGRVVEDKDPSRGFLRPGDRVFVLRDYKQESRLREELEAAGFRPGPTGEISIPSRTLPQTVRMLTAAGWRVEAEGKIYRAPGEWKMQVESGIDWFELTGSLQFGPAAADLPDLLSAVARKEQFVTLSDGTLGVMPEDWLEKYGLLAGMGKADHRALRFQKNQVGVLDALLAAQPEVKVDEAYRQARERLESFKTVGPADAPAGFNGKLREYQREGLGWMKFLQEFALGGCLADDMGLGKTIQVLALLETRRRDRTVRKRRKSGAEAPSLIVVPRSLVFNWQREAQHFTPGLRILDHTGHLRRAPGPHFDDYDAVLTTYGTVRRDAADLKDLEFDYCILDEAQAIKNASTATAKAVRLINAKHRLALSGTPIENHLGELWSLVEFLNPGMLGGAAKFQAGTATYRNPDDPGRALMARSVRPIMLRRTKDQVAKDLPPKTEQTLYCELEGQQRKHYDQLRSHYRSALLSRVDEQGMSKSKMQVLEALLRLRQTACHPGLVDASLVGQPSAKLDVLVPQLAEVAEEGHKALVFSQFTKLLAIVRDRLDAEGIFYEYLDGQTRDREARVRNFHDDPECKVFLISLKAGGLGLNLTGAEYVFLLDPWWNPAVEAQAIDRTHRIGQTRPVFAYRIIAKDTVEEKVLELQKSKRDLADSILSADNSLIRTIQREDLELLLS